MLLLKSIILGFSVSAPVGPIGLLCIQRTISKGKAAGFLTGMGAVTANIIYAAVAAFGFSAVSAFLLEWQFYLRMVGVAFLLCLGIRIMMKEPAKAAAKLDGESRLAIYLSTFFVMITNPVTILNFIAMFAGLGFEGGSETDVKAFYLVLGVFLGATFWWSILSFTVSIFRTKIILYLPAINKMAGVLIILLAVMSFINIRG